MPISVDTIPNRTSRPAILLREAWREGKRIRRRTLAKLTQMPPELIDAVRATLKGGVVFPSIDAAVDIQRSYPHGHVAAVLGTMRSLGMPRMLGRKAERNRALALAGIAARVIEPASKLATARALSCETATSSLGRMLELDEVTGNEMLNMLDWLLARQPWIEKSLAKRHLGEDHTLILYDVSSSYVEGRCCPLAAFGYNRDGKRGKRQIVYGLLCAKDGCPVAIEVFQGNTADPATLSSQIMRIRKRFNIRNVALVGDRGMITSARIRADIQPAGLDWISALTTRHIRKLTASANTCEALEPEALMPDQIAEITSPKFSDERLMVCLNPRLRAQRRRTREDLLRTTEQTLEDIAKAVKAGRLKGQQAINRNVGRLANRSNVAKHFDIAVTDHALSWQRREQQIAAEARLDGIYVIRTSLNASSIDATQTVQAYKSLSQVERAFRILKNSCLNIRPLHVYSQDHVKAQVLLCMLAFHVEWHLRRRLAPLLFEDDNRQAAKAQRNSPIEPAQVSPSAAAKARRKRTPEGWPVHNMSTLLADLATLTINDITLPNSPHAFTMLAKPTTLQQRAFEILNIDPAKGVAM